ncbi:hypothetical protein AAF712_000637 [Marasmius tenuissimus]|uniref:Uncharacterized protein n=1 Tax=Marasmius tenuissimus TaxID=585030 RepID=A0ABR3ACN6_9AGAR
MKFAVVFAVVSAASFIAALPTPTDLPSLSKLHARQTTNIFAADAWENENTQNGGFATLEWKPSSDDVAPTTANVQATSSKPLGERIFAYAAWEEDGQKRSMQHGNGDDIFAKSAWAGVPRETGRLALAKDEPAGVLTSTDAEATIAPNSGTPPPIFAFDAWEAE